MASLSKQLCKPICFSEVALVGIEVTDRCNAHCMHCYRGAFNAPYDVPLEVVIDRLSALPERPEVVSYLGGEPLLRSDIGDLVNRVGIPAIIFTNGWPLPEAVDALSSITEAPVIVYVSLEYPDRRQDEHCRLPGLIDRVKRGLKALSDINVEARVMTTLMSGNASRRDIESLVEFAASYCRNEANDLIAFHRYMPTSASDPLSPSPEQLNDAFYIIEDACKQYGLAIHIDDPLYMKKRCGLRRYYIDSRGLFSLCGHDPRRFYTVKLVEEARREAAEVVPAECLSCKYVDTCAGGSVQARLRVWGTLKRRDPACML